MMVDIIEDYTKLIKDNGDYMDKYEAFDQLISKYIILDKINPNNFSFIASLWEILSEHINKLNAEDNPNNVTALKKIDVWGVNQKTGKMNKPVILRVVRMGPYHDPHTQIHLSAVNEKGENIVNLINFNYGDTPHLMPSAREKLESKGYDTSWAKWNKYGSLELKQIKRPY
jgi:hypothetical protein